MATIVVSLVASAVVFSVLQIVIVVHFHWSWLYLCFLLKKYLRFPHFNSNLTIFYRKFSSDRIRKYSPNGKRKAISWHSKPLESILFISKEAYILCRCCCFSFHQNGFQLCLHCPLKLLNPFFCVKKSIRAIANSWLHPLQFD